MRACDLDDEKLDVSNGRWVRHIYPDDSECSPAEQDATAQEFRVPMLQYYGDRPPECWHRDDLTLIGNSCGEPGCQWVLKHRWVTDLKRETNWYGFWQPYHCRYLEMGDNDIQQCVDRKKISSISLEGASIKQILSSYMSQKLQAINMTTAGNRTVFLDTLKMPHLLWHKGVHDYQELLETNFPSVVDDTENEHYFITGFYYTSEREPNVQVDRSLQYSQMAHDVLTPKGYKMLNAFDVTSAFAFDTDGQVSSCFLWVIPYSSLSFPNESSCYDVSPNSRMVCTLPGHLSKRLWQSSSTICAVMFEESIIRRCRMKGPPSFCGSAFGSLSKAERSSCA